MSLSDSILNSVLKKDEPVEQPQTQPVDAVQENVSKTPELSEGLQSLIEEKKPSVEAPVEATEVIDNVPEQDRTVQEVKIPDRSAYLHTIRKPCAKFPNQCLSSFLVHSRTC